MSSVTRIYAIFPRGGGFSTRTVDYRGTVLHVAATSVSQAYYLAGRGIWASDADAPLGLVEIYEKSAGGQGDHRLWCGCRTFGDTFKHNQSRTAAAKLMRAHLASAHPPQ